MWSKLSLWKDLFVCCFYKIKNTLWSTVICFLYSDISTIFHVRGVPHSNFKVEQIRDGSVLGGVYEVCKCFIIFFSKGEGYSGIKLTNFMWFRKKPTHQRSQGWSQVLKLRSHSYIQSKSDSIQMLWVPK